MIVSMYGLYQLVQLDQNPMIITVVSDANANTGKKSKANDPGTE